MPSVQIKNVYSNNLGVSTVIDAMARWHYDRDLIKGSSDEAQLQKLYEEFIELETSLREGKSPIDDIGDMINVLINIAERHGLSIEECMLHAYNEIKDRTGKKVNGVFVKDD